MYYNYPYIAELFLKMTQNSDTWPEPVYLIYVREINFKAKNVLH